MKIDPKIESQNTVVNDLESSGRDKRGTNKAADALSDASRTSRV